MVVFLIGQNGVLYIVNMAFDTVLERFVIVYLNKPWFLRIQCYVATAILQPKVASN